MLVSWSYKWPIHSSYYPLTKSNHSSGTSIKTVCNFTQISNKQLNQKEHNLGRIIVVKVFEAKKSWAFLRNRPVAFSPAFKMRRLCQDPPFLKKKTFQVCSPAWRSYHIAVSTSYGEVIFSGRFFGQDLDTHGPGLWPIETQLLLIAQGDECLKIPHTW